ncbi:MAG: hypothetical protein R3223_07460 [Longimicrobiales bacterium]|nr:hypothetical protein [Longimicrobiales bacterium]
MSITNRAPGGGGSRIQIEVTNDPSRREVVLDAPVMDVWTVLPAVFADLDIEAPVQDIGSFQFGNPEFSPRRIEGRRLSSYLDCGAVAGGSRADRYQVVMQFIVGLSGADEGTRIRTIVDAYASPRDVSGNAVHCLSRGTLEERLAELVLDRLAAVD